MVLLGVLQLHCETLDLGGLALCLSLLCRLGDLVLVGELFICLRCFILGGLALCKERREVLLRHLQDGDDGGCNVTLCSSEFRLVCLALQCGLSLNLDEG